MLARVLFLGAIFCKFSTWKTWFQQPERNLVKNEANSPYFKIYLVGIARYLQQVPSRSKNIKGFLNLYTYTPGL
jgi:hypothetical protein